MASVKRYSLRAPATLLGAASGGSLGAPCKGARQVIFHFKSTDAADSLSAVGYNVANDPLLWLAGAGAGMTVQGAVVGNRMDRADGISYSITPTQPSAVIPFNYVQATFTAAGATPANDISGFEITAEVIYDTDLDEAFGQTFVAV